MAKDIGSPEVRMKRTIFLPLILAAVVYLLSTSGRAVIDYDEGYYSQAARNMVESGDYVTPYVNGIRFLDKPPLLYWITAASFQLFGINEFALRLPSAIGVLALVWVVVLLARLASNERTAIIAGIGTAFSTGTFLFTRESLLDIWLVLFISIAMYAFLKWHLDPEHPIVPAVLFYAALAGAVLCKSLVGVAFPMGIAVCFFLLQREWPRPRTLHLLPGSLMFLALAVPWHWLAATRNPGFLYAFFVNEQFLRFLGRHDPPVLWSLSIPAFWGLLLVWFFPWTAFLPAAIVAGRRQTDRNQKALVILALSWFVVIMGFFTVSGRLEHYSFPVLPALSLLVGVALGGTGESRAVRWGFRGLAICGAAVLIAGAAAGIWLMSTGNQFGRIEPGRTHVIQETDYSILAEMPPSIAAGLMKPAVVTIAGMALGFPVALWFERRRHRLKAVLSVASVMIVLFAMTEWSLRICEDLISSKKFALAVAAEARPGDRMVVVGDYESANSLNFYEPLSVQITDGELYSLIPGMKFPDAPQIVLTPGQFDELWKSGNRVFALLPVSRLQAMNPKGRTLLEVINRVLICNW